MGRKIADQAEAAESTPKTEEQRGTTFIKNQFNEVIRFEDGTSYKFRSSKETFHDPKMIENLRAVADRYNILEPDPR